MSVRDQNVFQLIINGFNVVAFMQNVSIA